MQFWGYMGIPLGISGDQVGMNGDEGGRGWGVRRFGERYSENKGLSWKNVQKGTKFAADLRRPVPACRGRTLGSSVIKEAGCGPASQEVLATGWNCSAPLPSCTLARLSERKSQLAISKTHSKRAPHENLRSFPRCPSCPDVRRRIRSSSGAKASHQSGARGQVI